MFAKAFYCYKVLHIIAMLLFSALEKAEITLNLKKLSYGNQKNIKTGVKGFIWNCYLCLYPIPLALYRLYSFIVLQLKYLQYL